MRTLFLWALFIPGVFTCLSAQDAGILKIITVPVLGDSYAQCGDSLLTNTFVSFPTGVHKVSLWAPGYEPFDTLITIQANETTLLKKFLSKTPEYEEHLLEVSTYKRKVRNPRLISLGVSTMLTGISTVAYFNAQNNWDEVLIARDNYNAVDRFFVATASDILADRRAEYDRSKDQYYAFGISTAVSWATTLYVFLRHRGKKKPTFSPEDPPFDLSYQQLNLNHIHPQGPRYHTLTAKFSF